MYTVCKQYIYIYIYIDIYAWRARRRERWAPPHAGLAAAPAAAGARRPGS